MTTSLEFAPVAGATLGDPARRAFLRQENPRPLGFTVRNVSATNVTGAAVRFRIQSTEEAKAYVGEQEEPVPDLSPRAAHVVEYALDTRLRPGQYRLTADVVIPTVDRHETVVEQFDAVVPPRDVETWTVWEGIFTIVPRSIPHGMPVIMWGIPRTELQRAKSVGCTHCLVYGGTWYEQVWKAGEPPEADAPEELRGRPKWLMEADSPEEVARLKTSLDEALAIDLRLALHLAPRPFLRSESLRFRRFGFTHLKLPLHDDYCRVQRSGRPYRAGEKHGPQCQCVVDEEDVCPLFPRIQQFCHDLGSSVGTTYGEFPGLAAILINSEVRDHTQLCFHQHDQRSCLHELGTPVPVEATCKLGHLWEQLDTPPSGNEVVPDDHSLYRYFRWFWKEGDGWNRAGTLTHQGLKAVCLAAGRREVWTWFDPAVRTPSVWGSGGEVDCLSQWTYTNPDPIRIGMATDELLAMAKGGRPNQSDQTVMCMTQLIWNLQEIALTKYRELGPPADTYITVAPMHLREAFWAKISRPIQGIMFHDWQVITGVGPTKGYHCTHSQTRYELERLLKAVIEPLGSTLMQVPDRPSDVAVLESFASQMFAGRGTFDWLGKKNLEKFNFWDRDHWLRDFYQMLAYAQMQPEIIYEETVLERGLDGFKVLVLVDCEVLPKSVVEKVKQFQARGGIVIGSQGLCPAVESVPRNPIIWVERVSRQTDAKTTRDSLKQGADHLRKKLDPRYTRYGESSNPDVVTRFRQYGSTDYLFIVNDLREFGTYVGEPDHLVMEDGLPSHGVVTINRPAGFVYDLVTHRRADAAAIDGQMRVGVSLGPCEGGIYMIADRAIDHVRVTIQQDPSRDDVVRVRVSVEDHFGIRLEAVVPVKVELLDPDGRAAEFSGYYGAENGEIEIRMDLAPNDVRGLWRVHAEELASGCSADAYFRVNESPGPDIGVHTMPPLETEPPQGPLKEPPPWAKLVGTPRFRVPRSLRGGMDC